MNRKKKASRVKMRMIKTQIKITSSFKITTYPFEEEADDSINGIQKFYSSKQVKKTTKMMRSRLVNMMKILKMKKMKQLTSTKININVK